MQKRIFLLTALLALAFGLSVAAKADSVKQNGAKSNEDVDFGHPGKHLGLSDKVKACGNFDSDRGADKFGDKLNKDQGQDDQGEHKDQGKHNGEKKHKNQCENGNGSNGNDEFADLDTTNHSAKFTSSSNTTPTSTLTVSTPEPASILLLFLGLASVPFLRRKRENG